MFDDKKLGRLCNLHSLPKNNCLWYQRWSVAVLVGTLDPNDWTKLGIYSHFSHNSFARDLALDRE